MATIGYPARGLSPRVRGNPQCPHSAILSLRSIPACAGEPPSRADAAPPQSVYPRVCGGTVVNSRYSRDVGGLSPRVRGNRSRRALASPLRGSIPACAGEPNLRYAPCPPPGVYPRVCGGTPRINPAASSWSGLSPRVRGNPSSRSTRRTSRRSIPACAGEPLTIP